MENIWADFRQLGQDLLTLGKDLFFSGSIIKIFLGTLLLFLVAAPFGLGVIFVAIYIWRFFQKKRSAPTEEA